MPQREPPAGLVPPPVPDRPLTTPRPSEAAIRPVRVFGWTADLSGCNYYRVSMPLAHLNLRSGWECQWNGEMTGYHWRWADVVIAQRTWLGPATAVLQKVARSADRPYLVYEIDDNLFEVDHRNSVAGTYAHPQVRENILRNAEVADAVTVTTEDLAEVLSQYNKNVHILPNCIPGWLLGHPSPARADGVITIGWQGSPTHEMDWDGPAAQIERYFRRANANPGRPSVELHTIGVLGPYLPKVQPHRHTGWFKHVEDYYRHIGWHVGLAPLRPHVFNQSKSDIRLVELAALGIPAVASAAGPYVRSIVHGETGYLVRQDHQWAGYLKELVDHPDERERIGRQAREWATSRTIETNIHRWEQVYRW